MSISWTAVRNQLISHLQTDVQGTINTIISLNRKNYVIITDIRPIINYLTIAIIRLCTKIYSKLNNIATSID